MSKLSHSHPDHDDCLGHCERCAEPIYEANVEAFELSGQAVCDDCADEVFDENGQFGVGA